MAAFKKVYFFDQLCTRFDLGANQRTQPFESIVANWHGMPSAGIDAAIKWSDEHFKACCIPVCDPKFWNDDRGILVGNNCYKYGCTGALLAAGRALRCQCHPGWPYHDGSMRTYSGRTDFEMPPPMFTREGFRPFPPTGARTLDSCPAFYYGYTMDSPGMIMRVSGVGSPYA